MRLQTAQAVAGAVPGSMGAGSLACVWQTTAASERARVALGGQARPAHADPRASVVRMHDGVYLSVLGGFNIR